MVFLFSFAERLIYPAVGPVERGGNSVFEFSTLSTGRHFHRAFLSLFSERNDAESTFLATCARFPSGSFGALFVFWFSLGPFLTQNFAPGGPREEDFGVPRPEMPLLLTPSCPRALCTLARRASRCGERCAPVGRECCRPSGARRSRTDPLQTGKAIAHPGTIITILAMQRIFS